MVRSRVACSLMIQPHLESPSEHFGHNFFGQFRPDQSDRGLTKLKEMKNDKKHMRSSYTVGRIYS